MGEVYRARDSRLNRDVALKVIPEVRRGLTVIGSRAEALTRFLNVYSSLARLPAPRFRSVDVPTLAQRVAGLETRLEVKVERGPDLVVHADPDQIEQLLINLVRSHPPVVVTDLQNGEATHRWPQILPGDKAVLFTAHTAKANFLQVKNYR